MKWIVICFSILITQLVVAQLVVENSTHNVLYRGYDNIIQLGSDSGDTSLTILGGPGVTVTKKSKGRFSVRVMGEIKSTTLTVKGKMGTLLTYTYSVKSLPTPEIYWGAISSGNTVLDRSERNLSVQYPDDFLLDVPFKVQYFSVTASDQPKVVNVTGDKLTEELVNWLAQLPDGTRVSFVVKYEAKDKTTRSMSGSFTL